MAHLIYLSCIFSRNICTTQSNRQRHRNANIISVFIHHQQKVKQQQMFLMLQHGTDTVVALNELHVIINGSIYLPPLQQLRWTAGQSEAVPCGDIGYCTSFSCLSVLLRLSVTGHHFGEIQAPKHICAYCILHSTTSSTCCLRKPLIWHIAHGRRVKNGQWVRFEPDSLALSHLWW